MSYLLNNTLSEESRISDISVQINKVNINPTNIADLQISFDVENKGYITFLDTIGISEGAPLTYGIIEIQYVDAGKLPYFGTFMITKIETVRYNEGSIRQKVYFENVVQDGLKNLFVSKAFSNMTILEMISNIFDEYNIPAILMQADNEKIYDHFVFPKNICFWDWMIEHLKYENLRFYFDKVGLKIVNRTYLSAQKIEQSPEEYEYRSQTHRQFTNIIEFRGITQNREALLQINTSFRNRFDVTNLQYNPDILGFDTAYEFEKLNEGVGMGQKLISPLYATYGIREMDVLDNTLIIGKDKDFRNIIIENQHFEILIQGLNTEKMYKKIKISVPRPKGIVSSEEDRVFSGNFMVTGIIDKIASGIFIQTLTLQSSDYGRGDEDVWN